MEHGGACNAHALNQAFARLKQLRAASEFRQLVPLLFERLPDFNDVVCVTAIHAAAHLRAPLTSEQQAAWEARTAQLLPTAGSQAVSLIAWALGKLGRQPQTAAMVPALRQAALRALRCTDPERARAAGSQATHQAPGCVQHPPGLGQAGLGA